MIIIKYHTYVLTTQIAFVLQIDLPFYLVLSEHFLNMFQLYVILIQVQNSKLHNYIYILQQY